MIWRGGTAGDQTLYLFERWTEGHMCPTDRAELRDARLSTLAAKIAAGVLKPREDFDLFSKS